MNTEQAAFKMKLKKGDTVQVIAVKDKGKIGKILEVNAKTGRVYVEKVNVVKRHVKASQKTPQGGIVEKELSIHYSNILFYSDVEKKGVRGGKIKRTEVVAKTAKAKAPAQSKKKSG